ncbi:peptidylprolyl isomerase [Paraburkholderia sp. CNPSo 3157]|uniref:peptidylprolyl isomerase n=1 Tax=Paraburkholderia franconis TaxID=2654983 RepID=A0A7X1TJS5_9BURK|nr:peptidylprolyl isomerase [Paraburkholderia franconis]MPW22002.1 peptidylprolyl isomerase [Paraburkholderia franconis]
MQNDLKDVATVNGVALHRPDEMLDAGTLRQRACTELLRQAAIARGLLDADDPTSADGATSPAATAAIDALLERVLHVPEPADDACRRYYDAHPARYAVGERVHARHVLFAVTQGVDVNALRQRAEACLLDVRCSDADKDDRIARAAAELSNCPSGAAGGDLGWLAADECAPEFAAQLFGQTEIGVLPRLVHSRFGLHVVEVLARKPGALQDFETVRAAVAQTLRQLAFSTAVRQYVSLEAAHADIIGVDIEAAATPLVQ